MAPEYHIGEIGFKISINNFILKYPSVTVMKNGETSVKVITYLKNHKEYMKYDKYLSEGYPIGSGVVESACSHVVKDRMEISGARWGINGSDSILKLRSVAKSKNWDEYWEFFTTQAKNNTFFPDEYNLMNVQEKMVA